MLNHPVMQITDVRDSIHNPAGAEDVRIFGEQRWRDDASLVLPRLEVRVGKEEEDFRELVFADEVGQELHRVGADACEVLVGSATEGFWWRGGQCG